MVRQVYVSISHTSRSNPAYHLRQNCKAQNETLRVPTTEEAVILLGLKMCVRCSESEDSVIRAHLRRRERGASRIG